jgi:hypothetical protein
MLCRNSFESPKVSMPAPRSNAAYAIIGDDLFVLGGTESEKV